jgi:RNA recognition motif-containing protein
MEIYLSQLRDSVTEDELRKLFAVFGLVTSVSLVRNRATKALTGCAIVEMPDATRAGLAITNLNHKVIKGQAIVVSKKRPRSEKH